MIYDDISDFAAALPPMQALIGLDLGEKTIGVAVSDSFLSIATPLETVRRKKFGGGAGPAAQYGRIGRRALSVDTGLCAEL